MLRHITIFNIFILKKVTLRTLLDEVLYVEIMNEHFRIEVIILRQQHGNLDKSKVLI